ncbi:hypothetical protein ACFU7Y_13120 [Kitasatospora sp. NPDC057542]|uniref:hypothetical protein n=1 Tax=Kitasatospora sp. NPDC057542 TaxID=3346162 RepID=UPI0036A9EA3F
MFDNTEPSIRPGSRQAGRSGCAVVCDLPFVRPVRGTGRRRELRVVIGLGTGLVSPHFEVSRIRG